MRVRSTGALLPGAWGRRRPSIVLRGATALHQVRLLAVEFGKRLLHLPSQAAAAATATADAVLFSVGLCLPATTEGADHVHILQEEE